MIGKKGALTAKQLVTLIILVISFVVVLLLWSLLNFNPVIDKEICHQSVIFRGSFNTPFLQASEVVPLKCQTEKICLTNKEDCQQFPPPKRGSGVTKIKISKDSSDAREEILETIANAMFDCNSMLGEGKILFMPRSTYDENYCLICSRFVFEEETLKKLNEAGFNDISYGDLYKYLQSRETIDGKSYLEFLHPNWIDWRVIQPTFDELKKSKTASESLKNLNFNDWIIDRNFEGGYAVVAQIAPKGTWRSWAGGIAVGAGTILTLTGIGLPVGIGLIGLGAVVGGATFWYTYPGEGDFEYSPPSIQPFDARTLKGLGCTSFETAP